MFPGTGSRSTSRSRANRIAEEYSSGDRVTVYVNPDNPERSYLIEEQSSLFHFLFIGIGLLTAIAGFWSFLKRTLGLVLPFID